MQATNNTALLPRNKRLLIVMLVLVILAFAVRWIYLSQMQSNNPIFSFPIIDSKEYVNNAEYLISTDWLGPSWPYFHPPLYTYFVALLFKIAGISLTFVRICQILIDLLNLGLIFLIANRVFGKQVAIISAGLYALYLPIIQFSVEILPPILSIFFLLVSLLFLLKFYEAQTSGRKKLLWLIVSAVGFGLLIITLPNFLLSLLFIVLWLLIYFKERAFSKRLLYAFIFLVIALIPTFFATLRNYLFTHEKVVISYNGGVNFYIGNNLDVYKTISIGPGVEWEKFTMYPYEQVQISNFAEQSQYWYRKSFAYIMRNPLDWLWLMVKKTVLFFNAHEFPRNFDLAFFERYSAIAKLPIFKLGFILPLSICAMFLLLSKFSTLRNKSFRVLILALILSYSFSIILFFIASRYRLPIIPFLIMLAAYTVYYILQKLRAREYKTVLIIGLIIIGAVVFTQIKFFSQSYPYSIKQTKTYWLIGATLLDNEEYDKAHYYLQKGLERPQDRHTYELHHQLGIYYSIINQRDKAIDHFKRSHLLNPNSFAVLNDLGSEFMTAQEYDSAIVYYNRAKKQAVCCAKVYLNLAECYFFKGDYDKIIPTLESYYYLCPSPHPIVSYSLGKFYMQIFQDWDKAIKEFEQVIQHPHGFEITADVYNNLGVCYYYRNDLDKAKKTWLKGLRLEPDHEAILNNLEKLERL